MPSAHETDAPQHGGSLDRCQALNPAAVAVALTAAVAFGWSTALMHHIVSRGPKTSDGLLPLLRHLLSQPRWLIGMMCSLTGLGLHTYALKLGSLAIVQPLVITGLVFAFVFRALLEGHLPSRSLIGWVLLTACGIAVFLIGARSVSSTNAPSERAAGVFLVIGVTISVLVLRASGRVGPNRAGLLLGVSGGIIFGLIGGVLKTVTGSAGLLAVVTTWPFYALIGLGASGFVINQYAYSRAPLASSLPVLNVINPLVALLFGVVVFDERPSGQPLTVLTELIGLVIVLAGIFSLARQDDQLGRPDAGEADEREAADRPAAAPVRARRQGARRPGAGRIPAPPRPGQVSAGRSSGSPTSPSADGPRPHE